ncbi:antitoxin Xre/MbcA/ParS toxin-binding domain-containing protein [Pararhodobacter sp. CCB-MM2]|uniref:type II RES/Xre toxin-antitoxin system antitoxin n=1 Tax=Pararhodobacter sp. CCB-MM2 TaxID=1786003 RepID=UPI0008306F7D|nr:antitoxin Xre/MbcA/ParS toxin-binding domain-containing protein [Pararhodobacter sp. CCB-MM2]
MAVQEIFPTDTLLARTMALLGGERAFRRPLSSRIEAHDALAEGLPGTALTTLLREFPFLTSSGEVLDRALGVSLRTVQRRAGASDKALNAEQSNRAWKFAEIVARATEVLGSQDEAVAWLQRPAPALDQRRPIELLGTAAGVELVEDLLTRLDYGVYS